MSTLSRRLELFHVTGFSHRMITEARRFEQDFASVVIKGVIVAKVLASWTRPTPNMAVANYIIAFNSHPGDSF